MTVVVSSIASENCHLIFCSLTALIVLWSQPYLTVPCQRVTRVTAKILAGSVVFREGAMCKSTFLLNGLRCLYFAFVQQTLLKVVPKDTLVLLWLFFFYVAKLLFPIKTPFPFCTPENIKNSHFKIKCQTPDLLNFLWLFLHL